MAQGAPNETIVLRFNRRGALLTAPSVQAEQIIALSGEKIGLDGNTYLH